MDDEDAFATLILAAPVIIGEQGVSCFFGFSGSGHAEQAGWFIDDDDAGVFVDDFDTAGQFGLWGGAFSGAERDDIA